MSIPTPTTQVWAQWETVLVCRHPMVEKIYEMGGTSLSKSKDFFRLILKDGHTVDFDTLSLANNYLGKLPLK